MKSKYLILAFFFPIFLFSAIAQNNEPSNATFSGKVTSVEYITSMASRPNDLVPSDDSVREAKDKRSIANQIVSGQDPQTEDDYFVRNRHEMEQSVQRAPASIVFDAYASGSQPTDPSLAVGPNHVMVVFNTGFAIYDKSGNQLLGQTSPNPAIFPAGGCCDLTVSYDNAADRWVLTFLGSGAQIAVSDGPNPLTAGWYIYNISAIQDYQKLSVWSDGYYITENTGGSNKVWVLERSEMLAGNAGAQILGFDLPGIATSGFFSPQVLNVTDNNLPAAGGATVVYMQDDAWSGVSNDHIKLWTIDVNWANTANSTISAAQQISTTPFISVFDNGSFSNLRQPGGGRPINIDALQATIMNQAQFRKFASHNSAVFNFVVDADASSNELAGVRWYEFRQDGDNQPWSLYQEGTYTAADSKHAWNASLAMDGQGNIGMGYTSMSSANSSSTVQVSSYFTGRTASDPLGTMTGIESLIANGNARIPGTRYGDYSKIDVDPSDDSTFWFINEYMNNSRRGVVGVFKIEAGAPDTEAPTNPSNVIASNITSSGATLNWTASTDNVGVSLYNVSIDGVAVGTSTSTSFAVTGLSPLTSYTASVNAQDTSGNISGSATTSFTTIDGGGSPDSEAPTAPSNVVASNIVATGATLNWTASTDNVGVSLYNVSIDGVVVGTSTSTSFAVTGLSPLTSYTASVNAEDAAGNVSGSATTSFTTIDGGGSGPGEIAAYYFETGLQGWTEGGNDCARTLTANSFEGSYSIRLRDNSNTSNAFSPDLNLSGNNQVSIEFHTYANSMENGEDFFVEFFNGSNYEVIGQYVSGPDFSNDTFFTDTIVLDSNNFNFTTNNRVRIRCDASGNNDQIYFDQVIISGDNVSLQATVNTNESAQALRSFTKSANDNIKLYPNPVKEMVNVEILEGSYDEITVFSALGNIVHKAETGVNKLSIDVSQLSAGMYFIRFVSNGLAVTKRFVKE
jgi:chitodextrinase